MTNNYDIQITGKELIKLEFKCNNTKVTKLPQFLEMFVRGINVTCEMTPISYSQFYYTNYLDKYLYLDDFVVPKPSLKEYIECVRDIKYKHPFIRQLYERKTINKDKNARIVSESIKVYLSIYVHEFNFGKIVTKIRESQQGKLYLFWSGQYFQVQSLDISSIQINKVLNIKSKCFDIQVEGFEYNLRVRLNWGNNNGVANHRWKFTWI